MGKSAKYWSMMQSMIGCAMVVKDLDIVVLISDVTDYDIVSSTVITVPSGSQATCISDYGDIGGVMIEGGGEDQGYIIDVPTSALTVIGTHITDTYSR